MKHTRHLLSALVLTVAFALSGCGGGDEKDGDDGNEKGDAAAAAIEKALVEDSGLMVGLTFGGIVLAATDEASAYFAEPVQADDVEVGEVTLSDEDATAEAEVEFGLVGQDTTCVGEALATLTEDTWDLGTLTVTSCE